ncbi:FAD-dependent monooxygenase [Ramlibacter algicola]|uniref:FAD-dependent monooxygenase n=1 Tax=Ramlibacter algicola TaxID=2795217 RepID=A0A934UR36_9BURK|nr:FAD-dependent monooxygenase [Ramlibacter algicola]MBK0392137.1 FAD-dependent monooxygenase [Ramlibacter algicola]
MNDRLKVLISGAGIGGLTAALALLQRGFDVEVFEQATELREIGAGVQLGPNGVKVLHALGLADELARLGVAASAKEVRIWSTGKMTPLFDLGSECVERYGVPYYLMHRADLHRILLDRVVALKPGSVHVASRGVSYRDLGEQVELTMEDGRTAVGDVLVGADGLHSRIRRQLAGDAQARFTGGMCWRGMVPIEQLPEHLRRPVGANWIGPHGHIITYPVRSGRLLNFVGHVERDDWQVESWTEPGTIEECAADYRGWHPDVQLMIRNITTPFKWALFLRPPLQAWSSGRVTLLGDACHSTLPYLAQGANMAIEDGMVLARALDAGASTPAQALLRYEQARVDRTTRIVNKSAENLQRFHNPQLEDPVQADQYTSAEWDPARIRERYDWLFRYDAVNVPF